MDCIAPGYGSGPYGMTPWGGGLGAMPGGPIPAVDPFSIFCIGPCGPMSVLLTFNEVDETGGAGQLPVAAGTLDQLVRSGGSYPTDDARIQINKALPQVFTFEFTAKFEKLPTNFTDLVNSHIFVGTTDAAGPCVGLFFSKIGIAYAGGVHHDGSGNMVLDSSFQALPNSQLLVSENEYWSIRIAASGITGGVYVYITRTIDLPILGHQLRYILPVIPADALAAPPADRTLISVRGTLAKASYLALDQICLGPGFIVPNLPPTADAGLDQAVRMCSIVQLDGTRSSDPEGAPITYKWRLVDAPLGSAAIFDGFDGATYPLPQPSGFTNKFYSPSLVEVNNAIGISAGDVLVVGGDVFTITGTGTDQNGFFTSIDGYVLPDSLLNAPFKLLFQNGISGATTARPTFYPDIAGLYKFDLVVFDGSLFSSPAVVIINVTESPIPRGCIPDLRFLWNYLSNVWGMVEDAERITLFWSALAQVAASELLTLWQIDYNKSLRDIQRSFQRRWLHYDPPLRETLPGLTSIRALAGGCRSVDLPSAGTVDFAGATVTLVARALSAPLTAQVPAGLLTPAQMATALQAAFAPDPRIRVRSFVGRTPSTLGYVHIDAPFAFTLTETGPGLFLDHENRHPHGTAGAVVGVRTYRVEKSLQHLGVQEGDLLMLGGIGYRVLRITDDPSDTWAYQRVTTADDLPLTAPAIWDLPGAARSSTLDFYGQLVSAGDTATIAVVDNNSGDEVLHELEVLGAAATASALLPLASLEIAEFLLDVKKYSVELLRVRRRGYLPIDDLVLDIPYLQDRIEVSDDKTVLRRNIDFYIERFRDKNAIRFSPAVWDAPPPDYIWAETTYLDNRPNIEGNFGIPADFTLDDLAQLPSNVDYLSAVRGLWYSYFNGPTLFNLRAGSQILLGLPFAEETGVIEEIRDDFSVTQGRILVRDAQRSEIVRSYTFPAALAMETNPATGQPYKIGDTVQQFAPLVTGVEVIDWVKDPRWFEGYMNQGAFFEIEKFHKFLLRVDSPAFNLPALLFVRSFILKIKPTYTYPLFVVRAEIGETEISVTDEINITGTLLLYDGACFQNGTISTMFDDPNPGGGGWWSQFDADSDPSTSAPVYPNAQPVAWGFDKNSLCPEDFILASCCVTFGAPTYPTFDSIFAFDSPVSTSLIGFFDDSWVTAVPATGFELFAPTTIQANGTITHLKLTISGDPGASDPNYDIVILVNGSAAATVSFLETTAAPFVLDATINVPVLIGDILSIKIVPTGGLATEPFWKVIGIELGASVMWAFDVQLSAGTYCSYKVL